MKRQHLFKSLAAIALSALMALTPSVSASPLFAVAEAADVAAGSGSGITDNRNPDSETAENSNPEKEKDSKSDRNTGSGEKTDSSSDGSSPSESRGPGEHAGQDKTDGANTTKADGSNAAKTDSSNAARTDGKNAAKTESTNASKADGTNAAKTDDADRPDEADAAPSETNGASPSDYGKGGEQEKERTGERDSSGTSSANVTLADTAVSLAQGTAGLSSANRLLIKSEEDLSAVLKEGDAVQMDDVAVASFASPEDKAAAKAALAGAGIEDVSEDDTVTVQERAGGTAATGKSREDGTAPKETSGADLTAAAITNGTGKRVALIDTGAAGIPTIDLTGEGSGDDNGHGTKMARVIEEAADGKADILSIKAIGRNGRGSLSNVYAAIKVAMEEDADIISLSFNLKDSARTEEAKALIREAVADGITIVAAAGNQGKDAALYFPGNMEGVITAGACTDGRVLSSSNRGACVDYYVDAASTSVAAAKLSGYIALYGKNRAVLSGLETVHTAEEFAQADENAGKSNPDRAEADDKGNNDKEQRDASLRAQRKAEESIPIEKLADGKEHIQIYEGDDGVTIQDISTGDGQNREGYSANFYPSGGRSPKKGNILYTGDHKVGGDSTYCIDPGKGSNSSSAVNVTNLAPGITLNVGSYTYGSWDVTFTESALQHMAIANYWFHHSGWSDDNAQKGEQTYVWQFLYEHAVPGTSWTPKDMNGNDIVSQADMQAVVDKVNDACDHHRNQYDNFRYYLIQTVNEDSAHNQRTMYFMADYHPYGHIRIRKQTHTDYTGIAAGNPCYSLAGAVYEIRSGNTVVDRLTTDGSGNTGWSKDLNPGNYTIHEAVASPGYQTAADTPVTVGAGEDKTFQSLEVPHSARADLTVAKKDTLGNRDDTDLSGTEFTFRYYRPINAGTYVNPANAAGQTPAGTWIVKAKKGKNNTYSANLTDTGYPGGAIPYGTLTIEETKKAEGMLLTNKTMTVGGENQKGAVIFLQYRRDGALDTGTYDIDAAVNGAIAEALTGSDYREPDIGTELVNEAFKTPDHVGDDSGTYHFVDTVNYKDAVAGGSYTFKGTLVNKKTGAAIPLVDKDGKTVDAAEKTVTIPGKEGSYASGEVRLDFYVESDDMIGVSAVAMEEMWWNYTETATGDRKSDIVAEHKDKEDDAQTVNTPKISTEAKDISTGDHVGEKNEETVKIVDRVDLTNLRKGQTYTVRGILMEKVPKEDTSAVEYVESPFLDDAGNEVKAELTFKADDKDVQGYKAEGESVNGYVELTFEIPKTRLDGRTAVVFEDLYHQGVHVAKHHDIDSEDQSVHYPSVRTEAVDKDTQDHVGISKKDEVVVDTIYLENLVKGQTYKVAGVLMDKDTGEVIPQIDENDRPIVNDEGEALPYTAEKTFAAGDTDLADYKEAGTRANEAASVSGHVELEFTVDSTVIEQHTIVVCEELYHQSAEADRDGSKPDVLVGKHRDLKDEAQSVHVPHIYTTAVDKETGTHNGTIGEEVTIVDTVHYFNLVPGLEYKVTGALMVQPQKGNDGSNHDPETLKEKDGKAIKPEPLRDKDGKAIKEEVTFRPDKADGTVDVVFTLNSSLLNDVTVTAFEDLWHKDIDLCFHHDINDQEQSVHYPAIGTILLDSRTEDHLASVNEETKLVDSVEYKNLLPDTTYIMKGQLMVKAPKAEDGPIYETEELKIDGKPVLGETVFTTPADDDGDGRVSGTVEVVFTYDATKADGMKLVAFEDLYDENSVWMEDHKDVYDDDQSIDVPKIRTNASDRDTQSHVGSVGKEAVIKDIVTYDHLIDGKEYTVKGTLMDRESGTPVLDASGKEVTSEVTFTPEKSAGSVEMTFRLDSTLVEGKAAVVFEDLYYTGVKVYSHADLEDEDQTIHYPKIETNAKINKGKSAVGKGRVTVVDEVTYHDLVPGVEYTLEGVLMDKAAGTALTENGQPVRVTASFRPNKTDGKQDISFSFDAAGLTGSYVAFETLYHKESGRKILEHRDLNNKAQTVRLVKPGEKVQTGDTPIWPFAAAGCAAFAAAIAVILRKKRREILE